LLVSWFPVVGTADDSGKVVNVLIPLVMVCAVVKSTYPVRSAIVAKSVPPVIERTFV